MLVKARLLLVEDSASQGNQVKTSLERLGYEVLWARSGLEGLKLARGEQPDVIILDVVMEDLDGFAVCRWLKMHEDTRDIPVIMLTVRGELQHRVEGLNVGANDYLPKPFADEELEARIFAALRIKISQTELRNRNSQLELMLHHVEGLAITDPLTGLYNRRRFADVLKREFALTKRYGTCVSCIVADLDHFKYVNDRFGHDAGDFVLREISAKLGEGLREVDLVARYGGEEFAILLPHTSRDNAKLVAERIANQLRKLRLDFEGNLLTVTASFGVSSTDDVTSNKAEDLVKLADAALYRAKERGRDCVVLYSPDCESIPEKQPT